MDPKIQNFFLFNGVVVLLIVAYILYRPKRHSSRFNLNEKGNKKALDVMRQDVMPKYSNPFSDAETSPGYRGPAQTYSGEQKREEKELNVIFNFNGHSFDAYEVLGVPAGSSRPSVEAAYKKVMKTADKDSKEFYQIAYKSITKK